MVHIKPFVPAFDQPDVTRIGWYEGRLEGLSGALADRRFDDPTSARSR